MKIPAKLLLVPSWMMNKINNSGENVKILTDLTKLSNIFTMEDVAFYISINTIFQSYGTTWDNPIYRDLLDSFIPTDIYSMTKEYIDRAPVNNTTVNDLTNIEYLDRVKSRSDAQLLVGEYWSEEDLSATDGRHEKIISIINRISTTSPHIYVYSLTELSEGVFGLVIKPLTSQEIEEYNEQGKDITSLRVTYNTLLESVSKFSKISELAQTPLFKKFVMLSND